MLSKVFLTACSAALVLLAPASAFADTVIEKVARTGVLTAGVRFGAVPYSYINPDGDLIGYSIDVLSLIEAQLEAELDKDIVVQMVEANDPADRIPMLNSGQIDIACDTQFTWERDRHVDFSISYGLSGIRFLTLANSDLVTAESLDGQKVAVYENSLGQDVMQLAQPGAALTPMTTVEAAFEALDSKQVAAIAGDTLVLAGLAVQRGGVDAYQLAPVEPLQRYGVACMTPENNSTFLNMVNYSIASLLQGYVSGDSASVEMVNQWFGRDGVIPLPPLLVEAFFEAVLTQRAQVPPIER